MSYFTIKNVYSRIFGIVSLDLQMNLSSLWCEPTGYRFILLFLSDDKVFPASTFCLGCPACGAYVRKPLSG
jgi:hypothetical protein